MASGNAKRGARKSDWKPRAILPRPSDRLSLNGVLPVSPFCLGLVDDPRAVSHAFEMGINFFFFTADMHWPLYEGLRRGLRDLLASRPGVRDEIVVAVVAYVTQPEFCHYPFVEALQAVPGLGRIDVTVAGGSYRNDFGPREEQFKRHGEHGARAFGVSFHERKMAATAFRDKRIDLGFVRYNALHRGAEKDLFPHVRAARAGRGKKRPLLYNFTSTQGFLASEHYEKLGLSEEHWRPTRTDYYRYVLAHPEIDGLLCAPRTPAQLDGLSKALEDGPLTEEEHEYMTDLADLALGKVRLA